MLKAKLKSKVHDVVKKANKQPEGRSKSRKKVTAEPPSPAL